MATLVLPAPAGPISSTASVVVVGSGAVWAGGTLGMPTGPPGGSRTCPVASVAGGAAGGGTPGADGCGLWGCGR
ncbi:hypothetical protein TNCT6_51990 [Streptomyces sp. 6-11-2]|nr:hypothetical protein TNCT6_51990 [Streptomyces sp. 6-11-2]